MKNEHLIPVVVKDIAESLEKSWVKPTDKEYQAQRLETIRDFCEASLTTYNRSKAKLLKNR